MPSFQSVLTASSRSMTSIPGMAAVTTSLGGQVTSSAVSCPAGVFFARSSSRPALRAASYSFAATAFQSPAIRLAAYSMAPAITGAPEALDTIAKVYELVVKPGVHRAPNVKVAEAAKIIENTQRDVNIALMNELSIIFSRIGINTYDVLEAAGTKWNFLKFYPGLVGGHCIGVDPYYLVYKANELKYHSQIISAGRFINDTMGGYIAKKLVKKLIGMGKGILGARVLVMGMTFKENVADIRNSKVVDIINELKDFGVDVDVVDPYTDSEEVKKMYGFKLIEKPRDNYDAIVVAVSHDAYKNLDEKYFKSLTYDNAVLVDVKGIYRDKIHELKYWSL